MQTVAIARANMSNIIQILVGPIQKKVSANKIVGSSINLLHALIKVNSMLTAGKLSALVFTK